MSVLFGDPLVLLKRCESIHLGAVGFSYTHLRQWTSSLNSFCVGFHFSCMRNVSYGDIAITNIVFFIVVANVVAVFLDRWTIHVYDVISRRSGSVMPFFILISGLYATLTLDRLHSPYARHRVRAPYSQTPWQFYHEIIQCVRRCILFAFGMFSAVAKFYTMVCVFLCGWLMKLLYKTTFTAPIPAAAFVRRDVRKLDVHQLLQ